MPRIYLDHAATTPLDPTTKEVMEPYLLAEFGNPSSLYQEGQRAHVALNTARQTIAQYLGVSMEEIIFTSGATESIHTAIRGITGAQANKKHIITSIVEHTATKNACALLEQQGYDITYLSPLQGGSISLSQVQKAITPETCLVSLLYVNNETGAVSPLKEIGEMLTAENVFFHVDAVQAVTAYSLHQKDLPCDAMSLSGHKCYGPKGIGVLFLKEHIPFIPLIPGNQEFGKRGGTQYVAGAVGLAHALHYAQGTISPQHDHFVNLRTYLIDHLSRLLTDWQINEGIEQHPGIISLSIGGISGQTLLIRLDLDQISVSTGSACSSKDNAPSHVLLGIGLSEEAAQGTLRISFGKNTTTEELHTFVTLLAYHVNQIRHMNITY